MVIKRLSRLFGRRAQKGPVAGLGAGGSTEVEPSEANHSPSPARTLITWESELRAIAAEASAWTIETGGDLFGRWDANPIAFLATKAGPKAQRNNAHFRLDVDYLRQLSGPLATDWALRYFGDWHSHHRLGLSAPSSGDRRRIRQLGKRNQFPGMAEIIVTMEGSQDAPIVRVHAWLYDLSPEHEPQRLAVKVLSGCSPVRQALIARRELPEQSLGAWDHVPLTRIRIGDDRDPPPLESEVVIDEAILERTLDHLIAALKQASGAPVEQHSTGFGHILVARLKEPHHLAFAVDKNWPMPVLEIHRLDRNAGTAEQMSARDDLIVPDTASIVEVFNAAKAVEGI